ncbi:MAG TPA: oligosaccharide flippase family protein, partial [Steroidobacteraceae bacterium]|nr:oligosaccharide flippase family protein [Steroidobacteraceae bacterium]
MTSKRDTAGGLLPGFMRSVGWSASGSLLQAIAQLLALVVLARLLSPAAFGIVSAASLVTQSLLIAAEFGVGACLVQRSHLERAHLTSGATLAMLTAFIVATILWVLAPWCAQVFGTPELTDVLRVYGVVFVIKAIATVAEATLQRELRFGSLAASDGISFIVGYAGVAIVCALAGWSYWSIVAAHIAQTLLRSAMLLRAAGELPSFGWTRAAAGEIARFSLGQMLSRSGSLIANQSDSFVAGIALGAAPLGLYGRAQQLLIMPVNQLGAILDRVLFPTLAIIQGDPQRFGRGYRRALLLITLLALPLTVVVIAAAPDIVRIVLGAQWGGAVVPLQILAAGLAFRLFHKISDPSARAAGAIYA